MTLEEAIARADAMGARVAELERELERIREDGQRHLYALTRIIGIDPEKYLAWQTRTLDKDVQLVYTSYNEKQEPDRRTPAPLTSGTGAD